MEPLQPPQQQPHKKPLNQSQEQQPHPTKPNQKKPIPPSQVESLLRREYSSKDIPGAVSRDIFYKFLAKKYSGISRRRVMERQRAWQLHQPVYRVPHTTSRPASRPFSRWQADLLDMTHNASRGWRYVLTVVDLFSKYAHAIPLNASREVARAMASTFKGGRPSTLQTDNGGEFVSTTFKDVLGGKTKHVLSRPYTPQAQGAVERFNGTLKRHLLSSILLF